MQKVSYCIGGSIPEMEGNGKELREKMKGNSYNEQFFIGLAFSLLQLSIVFL